MGNPGPMTTKGASIDRQIRSVPELEQVRFDERGLVPVVAQEAGTGLVLMVAWGNREALEATLETGRVHYWSRSRGALWRKGDTSGNAQWLESLHLDCDGDTLLAVVRTDGPACHTLDRSCFGSGTVATPPAPADPLAELWATLRERERDRPEGSWTTRLLSDENLRTKKLGEEVAELILALARGSDRDRIREEGADLLYHLLVALLAAGVDLHELLGELAARRK